MMTRRPCQNAKENADVPRTSESLESMTKDAVSVEERNVPRAQNPDSLQR
jgi:hypothetical protein